MENAASDRLPAPLAVTEAQLRSVLLAQAIVQADAAQALLPAPERAAALHEALADARAAGQDRPRLADVAVPHAQRLVARAAAREPALAALQAGDARWRWLARALPVLALLAGLLADRLGNAHRVDLLSPPLLLVLAWNVAVYAALLVRALRRRAAAAAASAPPAAWARWLARLEGGRRGPLARIAADFHARWLAHTRALQGARSARVLHLAAAAWGAGLALSLLLRGLVVRYQFGWESTFLDAAQVHALARVLFWPLTALTGLAPFSLPEIAAAQDFAGVGAAGHRWVWMYVGLLVLVVVLPRAALAAWARWREARLAARCTLDLAAPAFDALRDALPADIVLGVAGASAAQAAALAHVLALHEAPAQPAPADRLRCVLAPEAPAPEHAQSQPESQSQAQLELQSQAPTPTPTPTPTHTHTHTHGVDAVLLPWSAVSAAHWPAAWQGAPVLALPWGLWGASGVLEPVLFERLAPLLPGQAAALGRLRQAWAAHQRQRLDAAALRLAQHLRACAALSGEPAQAPALAQQWLALDADLRALYALPAHGPGPQAPSAAGGPAQAAGRDVLAVVGTSAGAAAGAAAGAKAGALIDVGLGGLTLGAGTAVGALLGGATAWALRGLQQRGAAQEAGRRVATAACVHALVLAHQARLPADALAALAERWGPATAAAVAARAPALQAALQAPSAPALAALLGEVLQDVLQRSFAHAPAA